MGDLVVIVENTICHMDHSFSGRRHKEMACETGEGGGGRQYRGVLSLLGNKSRR